jgi:hypothetical protein
MVSMPPAVPATGKNNAVNEIMGSAIRRSRLTAAQLRV